MQLLIGDETAKTISSSLLSTGGRKGIQNAKLVSALKMKLCEPFRPSVNATKCYAKQLLFPPEKRKVLN